VRLWVQISAEHQLFCWRFRGFPRSLKEHVGIVPGLGHARFLLNLVIYNESLNHRHWLNSPFRVTAFHIRFCHISSGFKVFGLRQTPNVKDQVPVFTSPSECRAQGTGVPFFAAFYDSQGYSEGVSTHLHTGNQ
jgi:hypothetical protein